MGRMSQYRLLTIVLTALVAGTEAFRKGVGFIVDPEFGGLVIWMSTPKAVEAELSAAGMRLEETIGGALPAMAPSSFIPWYYYAATAP
jgi:hypothetical protein